MNRLRQTCLLLGSVFLVSCTHGSPPDATAGTGEDSGLSTDSGSPTPTGTDTGARDSDGDGTPDAEDCAPDDPTVYPGAAERCDGVDDNCDGDVDGSDAVDASVWYADVDADGYGDATVASTACDAPSGFVVDDTDCDDADMAVHPGASEICNNGKDDDCDGDATACRLSGTLDLADIASQTTNEGGWLANMWLAGGCDVDGDAVDDLVVGVPQSQNSDRISTWLDQGVVYVVRGGTAAPSSLADAWARIAPDADEEAGAGVSCAGDIDGDGSDDVWIGAPNAGDGATADRGAIYLVEDLVPGATSLDDAVVVILGTEAGSSAVAPTGNGSDLTGDGAPDVAFVETVYDGSGTGTAVVRVFATPAPGSYIADEATATAELWTGVNLSTVSVEADADLDGDGIADLALGPYTTDASSAVYVFAGPLSGTITAADADAMLDNASDETTVTETSFAVRSAGDIDGDGIDDLAVGYPHGEPGNEVFVMTGPWTGTAHLLDATAHFQDQNESDGVGSCIAGGGDVDGDGATDLLIGAFYFDDGDPGIGANYGAAYLFYGPLSGELSADDAALLVGHNEFEKTGNTCAFAGDRTGDGNADLAIASFGVWDYGSERLISPALLYLVPGGGF